jgi:hypothetical protein
MRALRAEGSGFCPVMASVGSPGSLSAIYSDAGLTYLQAVDLADAADYEHPHRRQRPIRRRLLRAVGLEEKA